jgi:hypothetical protein
MVSVPRTLAADAPADEDLQLVVVDSAVAPTPIIEQTGR